MNYSDLKTEVLSGAFPLGVPENLRTHLESYVLSSLIEIQRYVPCVRYRHDNVYAANQTFWLCGASVITAPEGRVLRVYTVENEGWCDPVIYNPVTMAEFRRWQAAWQSQWRNSLYADAVPSGTALPMGFNVPDTSSDAACGRATVGVYAFDPTSKRLYIGPWIQSTESVVVEWQGIKRTWNDGDLVPSGADFVRLCQLFVEREYGRRFGCSDLGVRERAWDEALADYATTCQQESQLHGAPRSADEASSAIWSIFTPDPVTDTTVTVDSYTFAFVGNVGDDNPDPDALPALVSEDAPSMVFLLGDSKRAGVGAVTTLSPWSEFTADGRVRAALGNVDLDDGVLAADVRTLAGNPGNGRYFTVTVGPVSVFVINSGINSADDVVEPDSNFAGSKQYTDILASIIRSTSPWKFVVLHHSPYTSGSVEYPGEADLRWVSNLPVHAVLSGAPHHYERLLVKDRTHINVGSGGGTLETFRDNPYPGSQSRQEYLGYVRLTADDETASFDFVDIDGTVRDSIEFDNPGVLTVLADMPSDPSITSHPASMVVAEGSSALLSVAATGTEPFTYQWQKDGVDIPDSNDPTYLAEDVTESSYYRVLVEGPEGAQLSKPAQIIIGSSGGSGSGGIVYFDSVADLVADDRTDWVWALVVNFEPGDGNLGLWQVLPSSSVLVPNGTDVLQTAAGRNVFRVFYREYHGPETAVDTTYATYTVSRPVWFASYTELEASSVNTPLAVTVDINGALAFFQSTDGSDESGTKYVDWVANSEGIHYRRIL